MNLNNILSIILSTSLISKTVMASASDSEEETLCILHNTLSSNTRKISSAASTSTTTSSTTSSDTTSSTADDTAADSSDNGSGSSTSTTTATTSTCSSSTTCCDHNLCLISSDDFNSLKSSFSDDHATATATTSSTTSTTTSSSSASNVNTEVPSYQQFCDAVGAYNLTTAGGNPPVPSQDLYNSYCDNMVNISLGEQAQFLANSIWETGGLQYMTELACNQSQCDVGKYYGRGFLQLSWDYNYQNASTAIYGDSSLYDNPDMAAENDGAWKTAMWFWKGYCRPSMEANNAVENKDLGYSVKAINGGLECGANPSNTTAAKNRLTIYNQILSIFGIGGKGSLTGCC